MSAARTAADETISFLLSLGANPDKTVDDDHTALIFAIMSKCITTINLLAPVTQLSLGVAIIYLATYQVGVTTGEVKQLVERAAQDKEAAIEGLLAATMFGSSAIIKIIANSKLDPLDIEVSKEILWMWAVKSDSEETVSALLDILPNPASEASWLPCFSWLPCTLPKRTSKVIFLAKKRGVPGVVKLLLPDTKVDGEEEREALRDAVLANTAQLLDQIPRDVEFTYNQKIDKLRPLLGKDTLVPYTTLLKHLHLPKAHFDDKMPMKSMVCSSDCSQKQTCQKIWDTLGLM